MRINLYFYNLIIINNLLQAPFFNKWLTCFSYPVFTVKDWDSYKKIIRASYFTHNKKNNVVHGSDSKKAAQREISLFFTDL